MAWVNQARCLYCGVRLALYRKLTDDEFCSAAHRKAFQDDQSRLAVERLQETHQLCNRVTTEVRAHVELEEAVHQGPPIAGSVVIPVAEPREPLFEILALDPLAYDFSVQPAIPQTAYDPADHQLHSAPSAPISSLVKAVASTRVSMPALIPGRKATGASVTPPGTGLSPEFETRVAGMSGIRTLPALEAVDSTSSVALPPEAIAASPRTWLPLPQSELLGCSVASYEPPMAVVRKLAMPDGIATPATVSANPAQPVPPVSGDVSVPEPVDAAIWGLPGPDDCSMTLPLPEPVGGDPLKRSVKLASPMASRPQSALPTGQEFRKAPARIRWTPRLQRLQPQRPVEPPPTWGLKAIEWCALATPIIHCPAFIPAPAPPKFGLKGGVPIPIGPAKDVPADRNRMLRAMVQPQVTPARTAYPPSRLTPLHAIHVGLQELPAGAAVASSRSTAILAGCRDIVRSRGFRLALMGVPIAIMILLWPKEQQTEAAAPVAVPEFVSARVTAIKAAIQNRAGVELLDDFRSGLDNWDSSGSLSRSWSYDQTGFVKPGPLALFRPSMGLSEYTFEFLGQIDHRALGWVYRAQDLRNYHVAKLVILRPGPLPTLGLVRYSVIKGRETKHIETVLPLNVHSDTVYRIRMEARGNDFSLYVQNQMVQFWSDWRLTTGGVGFFSGHGEQSRIRWMQVSHQYDAIGKLCAYFAPMAVVTYNLQPTMGAGKE